MANANLFCAYSRNFPPDPAAEFLLTTEGVRFSYGDLMRESARMASFLVSLGVTPGARVTVICDKSPAVVFWYLACLRAGLVFHPLNPAYTAAEIDFFISDASPEVCIYDAGLEPNLTPLLARHRVPYRYPLDAGTASLVHKSGTHPLEFETRERLPDDTAALLYSSGTTGKPKGILLSHANLTRNAANLTAAWGFSRDDVLWHALPIFHVHGLFVALGCVLMSGSRVLFSPRFAVDETLDSLPRATVMMGVPTYYTRLLASPRLNPERCANVRLFTCGSAPLLEETWEAFNDRTGHAIVERYGMTETSIIASNPLHGVRKAGSVGVPLPGTEVRV
ncbi:MAG: AMP-binding protein, partial [Gammaproteobacteria bacterium]